MLPPGRQWIFLRPVDGGPAAVHHRPPRPPSPGSVKGLLYHSGPHVVEGRCSTHLSGLLFIHQVSLATTVPQQAA